MIDEKLCLQLIITFIVGVHTLNKILWETYKTYVKQRTRNGLLKLNWTFTHNSKNNHEKIEDEELNKFPTI
jgi:hypothetical protein